MFVDFAERVAGAGAGEDAVVPLEVARVSCRLIPGVGLIRWRSCASWAVFGLFLQLQVHGKNGRSIDGGDGV